MLRLAEPVAAEPFIDGLAALKPGLDAKAREPGTDSNGPGNSDDE